ncbi:MAG: Flp family type IVb pilin [Sandaracinus sp.]|nr:Flp family type IVb pilin [Sandaracinus sp.]MCB9619749.1 Flp family type IVb pilin [Sandaracinus sp.]MCB9623324.1 Flp family type IVb pilin [Sandaracinus sp.]MCB9633213.1 Flp family type IVb pilin [Sandaracinus sp.]
MKIDLKSKLEKSLVKDEEGLSTVEYIIILILIAVIAIVAWQAFGSAVKSKVEGSTDNITNLGS